MITKNIFASLEVVEKDLWEVQNIWDFRENPRKVESGNSKSICGSQEPPNEMLSETPSISDFLEGPGKPCLETRNTWGFPEILRIIKINKMTNLKTTLR